MSRQPIRPPCAIVSRHLGHVPRAADGLLVCYGHEKKLIDMVAGITELVEDLLLAHAVNNAMNQRVTGSTDPGLQFDPKVADAAAHLHRTLSFWTRAVADQRRIAKPKDNTFDLVRFLERHLRWICEQPAVADFHDQLEHDLREARGIAFPSARRKYAIPNGRCIELTRSDVATREPQRCPGALFADISPADDLLPSLMSCDTCGIEITSADWMTWGRRAHKMAAVA